jgi:hypothetical protein
MEEIASRGKSGWFTSELQLSSDDKKQYDFLRQRRDEIKTLDPAQQQIDPMASIGGDVPSAGGEPPWASGASTGVTAIRQTQAAFVSSGREATGVAQQNAEQALRAQRGVQDNERGRDMQLTGTLVLKGLSEAVMQASGRHMEQTPDGTPVDMAGGTGSYHR